MLAHLSDRHFARLILGQVVDHAFRHTEVPLPEICFNGEKLVALHVCLLEIYVKEQIIG